MSASDKEGGTSAPAGLNSSAAAVEKKARRLNIVWLIPFLALFVTAGLLWNNTLNKGPAIEIYISDAEGIEAGRTLVKLRSVTVGHVTGVRLDEKYSKAVVSIQMEADTEDLLRSDTQFWLVKPRVENTGVTGLNTLLSGSYFETNLGTASTYSSRFTALDDPPAVPSTQPGVMVKLKSTAKRRLSSGDFVNFRGFNAGRVVSSRLDFERGHTCYDIFIAEPYSHMLTADTRFWISSGLDFSIGTDGVRINTDSLDSILRGGIEFDNLIENDEAEDFAEADEHTLFNNYDEARLDAQHAGLLYVVMIEDSIKNISAGSGVYFQNVKIGEVLEAPWHETLQEFFAENQPVPVLIALNYRGSERAYVQQVLADKAQQGRLCAQTDAASIISGENRIALYFGEEEGSCVLPEPTFRGITAIAARNPPSLQDELNSIAANIKALDLGGISDDLRNMLNSTSAAMQAFASSNDKVERTQLLDKMTASFESFTAATQSYSEGSAIYNQLQQTLTSIEKVLRDLDPALTQIGQDPGSVIFGGTSPDPIPGSLKQEEAK